MFFPVYEQEWLFSSFHCALLFHWIASINSVQETVIQFSTFCSSRVPFQLVFNNLFKILIICFQHFHVLMISVYYSSSTQHKKGSWKWKTSFFMQCKSLKFKPNSSPSTHGYLNTLLFETKNKVFSSRIFEEF